MIYTLTCNPSLDYQIRVEELQMGETNRMAAEYLAAGGKGINVSLMLKNLGLESTVLGFAAGFTGEEIIRQLHAAGLKTAFVRLPQGQCRINVKLQSHLADDGLEETEINARGPVIDRQSIDRLMEQINQLREEDLLILSGSLPPGLPDTFYMDLVRRLTVRRVRFIVDACGKLLVNTLGCRPFLVKPNRRELEELYDVRIGSRTAAIPYAQRLQRAGARNVLVSFGGEGALLVSEDQTIYESDVPRGTLQSAVGSGDSMVAGFWAGYLESGDYRDAFYMGLSAGSASAFSRGFATKEEVLKIFHDMTGK